MEIKEYDAEYTYDSNLDVINIEVKQDIPHKETIELEFGVLMDFNQMIFQLILKLSVHQN